MTSTLLNRSLRVTGSLMLLLAPLGTAGAQTNDEARLTLGVAAGYIGSRVLWDVPNQPILSQFGSQSVFHIHRETGTDISIGGHATFFPNPRLGLSAEFTYVGLGNNDHCDLVSDGGDVELATACDALKGARGSASTTQVQGGLVFRPLTRSFLQPYFKGMVGVAFTPTSTLHTRSTFGNIADTSLIITIYNDDNWKPIRATWTAAIGVSTAPSSGYQLHLELRQAWIPLPVITGPTTGQGFIPPHKTVIKGFPSILVGFDIVLEKRRGRRY